MIETRLDGRLVAAAVAGLAFLAAFASGAPDVSAQLLVDLTIAGLVVGGIFALSAVGLVTTYTATGVFNFAHGAVAITVAYVLWQLVQQWGVPLAVAAPVAILGVGPGIGVVLEVAVFRPLQRRQATVAELIVATLGVFVLLVGAVFAVWGPTTRTDPVRLFPATPLRCGGGPCRLPGTDVHITLGADQLGVVVTVAAVSFALWLLLRRTWAGTQARAVVDRRALAELSGIRAGRVAAASWALGCGLAGLTGVLLAPITFGLDPFRLTLLVMETFAAAVLARLVSLPLAVGAGLFLGLVVGYSNVFSFAQPLEAVGAPAALASDAARLLDPVLTSVSVFVLFATLLLNRQLDLVGGEDRGLAARLAVPAWPASRARLAAVASAAAAVLLPFVVGAGDFHYAHTMVGIAAVLVSIVVVTGFSGHLTLGQAAFAGFGAFMTGRLQAGTVLGLPALPALAAMVVAALACVPLGLAAGWPALRRRGLFLGLATLAFALVLQRYVFESFTFVAPDRIDLGRPVILGVSLRGDTAFYWFELIVLSVVLGAAALLRRGPMGRVLAALRDSEAGAAACGIDVRRYKLFVFAAGAAMAGLGGSLLGMTAEAFSSEQFITFNSLIWFAAVVVAGAGSIAGALLAAVLLTMLGAATGVPGLPAFVIGLGAVTLGAMPGGLVGVLAGARRVPRPSPASGGVRLQPSDLARRLLARSAPGAPG